MSALWPSIQRGLVWFHRWAGVSLCLLFAAWFASGAVLHFVPFPSLPNRERLARSEPIQLSRLLIAPAVALAHLPNATSLRLVSIVGRPVYVLTGNDGVPVPIAGDSGERLPAVSATEARTVAEKFSGYSAISVVGPLFYDQWVVHQGFDAYRPYYRVRVADESGTELYVSTRTGEVRQQTRRSVRSWNWCGAVVHWIYFTPLRKNWAAWDQTVWWVSLVALISTIAGIWLGIQRYLARRASGRSGISPYRGWMRWHHIVGLFASLVILFWIFSGWLSMDHGRLFSMDGTTSDLVNRIQGMPLRSAAETTTIDAIRAASGATAVSLHALGGHPFLAVEGPAAEDSRVIWLSPAGILKPQTRLDSALLSAIRTVWPLAARLTTSKGSLDDLYRHAEDIPADAVAFSVPGSDPLRIYVDHLTGQLLAVMDPSRRSYAWFYYALHTFNYPALIQLSFTRTMIVLTLLAGGMALSVTSIVIAVRRVRLKFSNSSRPANFVKRASATIGD
jgi:uncharacterized iron-regulated membrane protein